MYRNRPATLILFSGGAGAAPSFGCYANVARAPVRGPDARRSAPPRRACNGMAPSTCKTARPRYRQAARPPRQASRHAGRRYANGGLDVGRRAAASGRRFDQCGQHQRCWAAMRSSTCTPAPAWRATATLLAASTTWATRTTSWHLRHAQPHPHVGLKWANRSGPRHVHARILPRVPIVGPGRQARILE